MTVDPAKRVAKAFVGGFLWLVVLVPILAVSAYSLYFIGRWLGAPWFIAIAFSTCFDGVALFAARKSVDYAQAGLSGSFPKFVVRLFAVLAAFLQTFHARIGHELPGAWLLWASLPIGAMLVYEMHIRWERRKALARAGQIYPSPLPSFGLMTWILFPVSTLNGKRHKDTGAIITLGLRDIVEARRGALITAASVVIADFQKEASRIHNTRERPEPASTAPAAPERDAEVAAPEVLEEHRQRRQRPAEAQTAQPAPAGQPAQEAPPTRERHPGAKSPHSPVRHIREWAWAQPEYHGRVGAHARLAADIVDAYYRAHPEEQRA